MSSAIVFSQYCPRMSSIVRSCGMCISSFVVDSIVGAANVVISDELISAEVAVLTDGDC